MKEQILLKKDNNSKLRIVIVGYKDIFPTYGIYQIYRNTGQHGGTMTEQPPIDITAGKAGRSALEQVELEYNSILSDYYDKGYKAIEKYGCSDLNDLTVGTINGILAETQTDTKGIIKPMLAKTMFASTDPRWNQSWYASSKIDGVRCIMYWNADKKCVETSSRGGKDYNNTIRHIIEDESVIELFEINPELILDGELYIHGKPLSYISGLCRASVNTSKAQEEIRFYIFDIVNALEPFRQRLKILQSLERYAFLNLALFDKITFVQHQLVSSYEETMALHTTMIENGYEGLVLRDPTKKYGYGSRDWRMIKVKVFQDDEFRIMGATPGLRPEDMVFIMKMKDGKTFEAKPVGDRILREWYLDNIDILIGQYATVKFFGYGVNGRPNLPVFKCLRNY